MENIDIEKINKAKEVVIKFNEEERFRDGGILNNSIDMLLKYINELEKQLGIEKALNGMRRNHVENLTDKLDQQERKIKELQDKLNKTKLKQLEDLEKGLDLQITNKKYQIEKYLNAIRKIESEIMELNASLDIIN